MCKLKIIFRLLIIVLLFTQSIGCKKAIVQDDILVEEKKEPDYKITAKDISAINYTEFALSDLSENAIKNWLKFQELSLHIEALKKGDLIFFKDDLAFLRSFIVDLKNEIPEALKSIAIEVRLKALETSLLKFQGSSNFSKIKKERLLSDIADILIAHTNLIFQINKKFEKDSQNIEKPQ